MPPSSPGGSGSAGLSKTTARQRLAWGLPALVTVAWAAVVTVSGMWGRVGANWEAAVTMMFGSFLSGSSPLGGGAVSFPVFTKLLEVPAPVARSFGLSIQAVGMTMAVVSIVLYRRRVVRAAVVPGTLAAIGGFAASLAVFGVPDELFWPPSLASAWVKATFSIVLGSTALLMLRRMHHHATQPGVHDGAAPPWSRSMTLGVVIAGFGGGALSALTGTGANIALFLFLVVVAGSDPTEALPTALVAMAAVSVVGLVLLGLIDGQLDVEVVGDRVTSVGGMPADLDAARADLFGLWLAALPVAAWGAPLGSLAASLLKERWLVGFVAILSTIEVITTLVLVDEMRSSIATFAYVVGGLVLLPAVLIGLANRRRRP